MGCWPVIKGGENHVIVRIMRPGREGGGRFVLTAAILRGGCGSNDDHSIHPRPSQDAKSTDILGGVVERSRSPIKVRVQTDLSSVS